MSLTILSDDQISDLLETLTQEEARGFIDTLRNALREYSTGTQSIKDGTVHQPERISVHSNTTGATTLFMPSISSLGHAVKVVTLSAPSADKLVDTALPAIRPTGSVTLYSPQGSPIGFLHAKTLTAFRTALASSCLIVKRASVRTLVVFGSGLQAYWHMRLALMLRGDGIRHVYIINKTFSESAKETFKKIHGIPQSIKQREGWEQTEFGLLTPSYREYDRLLKEHLRAADVIYCCTPSTVDLFEASILTSHEGRRKGRLIIAIGSYTRYMRELPRELLLQATKSKTSGHHFHKHAIEGGVIVVDTLDGALKEAGEIIEAGLQPNQLVELGELVMIHRLAKEEEESLMSQSSAETSSINESTESLASPGSTLAGSESGNSVPGNESRRSSSRSPSRKGSSLSLPFHHRRSSSQGPVDEQRHKQHKSGHDHQLARWLSVGNVIYKSVGLGLMDLVVGFEVVRLAQERGLGSHVEGFS
ncbi:NAD(P)-binding protein [Daldinia caldariorum]|uniref:NAD(P)-binding protein n=1 Tax=Daldinia caldariorum TaxID=326644 RepID=UPI002007AED1|nr:NAD(P)-binding protein [Daldinia caldariorum]KAI1473044.1 NAD(P)-binding protein [Daldinia caldariorum]